MQAEARRRLAAKLRGVIVDAAREAAQGRAPVLEVGRDQRGRSVREIRRISDRYGWSTAVETALDHLAVPTLRHLDDAQLEALSDYMRRSVDNAMAACDLEDDLPAR